MNALSWLAVALVFIAIALIVPSRLDLSERLSPRVTYRVSSKPLLVQFINSQFQRLRESLQSLKSANLNELVEISEVLVIFERLLSAGDSTVGALEWMASRSSASAANRGSIFLEIQKLAARIRAGANLVDELRQWQKQSETHEVQEFLAKLISATTQGSDIVAVLGGLRRSVDSSIRAKQLSNFSGSETKMLVPLVFLVLPITVMFAVFPSLTLLNLDFAF